MRGAGGKIFESYSLYGENIFPNGNEAVGLFSRTLYELDDEGDHKRKNTKRFCKHDCKNHV
jgi:hypothetical protein